MLEILISYYYTKKNHFEKVEMFSKLDIQNQTYEISTSWQPSYLH